MSLINPKFGEFKFGEFKFNEPFTIKFYSMSCEKNRIDKSEYLSLITEIEGNLREESSLINTSITIQLKDELFNSTIVNANYCYINRFNRYYFISNITVLRNNLFKIDLSVDTLMTYHEVILNTKALVSKNEFKFNKELIDDLISYENRREVDEHEITLIDDGYIDIPIIKRVEGQECINNSGTLEFRFIKDMDYIQVNTTELINKGIYKLFIEGDFSFLKTNPTYLIVNSSTSKIQHEGTWTYSLQDQPFIGGFYLKLPNIEDLYVKDSGKSDSYMYINLRSKGNVRIKNDTFINYDPTYVINVLSTQGVISPEGDYIPMAEITLPKIYSNNNVLSDVSYKDTGAIALSKTKILDRNGINTLLGYLLKNKPQTSFITSLMVYPFEISKWSESSAGNLDIGSETLTNIEFKYPLTQFSDYYKFKKFKIERKFNNYLDFEPFTQYELFIPFVGWQKINASDILDKYIRIIYVLNYQNTQATCFLIDETSNKLIASYNAQLGISINIDTTNAREIDNQKVALKNSLVLSTIGAGVGALSGNPIAAAGSGLSLLNSINQYVVQNRSLYEMGSSSPSSGDFSLYMPRFPRIRIISNIKVNDNGYTKQVGKPLNEVHTLSELKGYTEIVNIHLDELKSATLSEINDIEIKLKDGFII